MNSWLSRHRWHPLTGDEELKVFKGDIMAARWNHGPTPRIGMLHVRYKVRGPKLHPRPGLRPDILVGGESIAGKPTIYETGDDGCDLFWWVPGVATDLRGAELRLYDPADGHLVATCRLK